MNISEILKDCPKGTKLYSPICGECYLVGVEVEDENYHPAHPIRCTQSNGCNLGFDKYGRVCDSNQVGECLLFPSKENRDWSTFKVMPEFKKGDFVYLEGLNGVQSISLYEGTRKNKLYSFATLFLDTGNLYYDIGPWGKLTGIKIQRLATEEEKQELLKAIDEKGYVWDEEKLELRKKRKKLKLFSNKYYTAVANCFHDGVCLLKIGHTYKGSDQEGCVVGEEGRLFIDCHDGIASSYLRHATPEEINEFEESRHKPRQFKPFDKVLARDNVFEVWFPADYGFYFEEFKPRVHILSGGRAVEYVVPYEGNEHLLGTSKNTK